MVLADSRGLSRIPRYSGTPPGDQYLSRTGPLPSMARGSTTLPLGIDLVTPRDVCRRLRWVPRPRCSIADRLYHYSGLGSSRFARRYSGSRCCFLFLGVLRCFNSPGSLYRPYVFRPELHPRGCRVFPFGNPRINAWSAANRGLSQPPTSFIGGRRQGIHRWPFVAWENNKRCSCSL